FLEQLQVQATGRLTRLNEARLKVGGCTNAAAGCNLPELRSTKPLPATRAWPQFSRSHACCAPVGLIDGSGYLGQYQQHFVAAFASRFRFAGASPGTNRPSRPSSP